VPSDAFTSLLVETPEFLPVQILRRDGDIARRTRQGVNYASLSDVRFYERIRPG
jgi:hypothetical protein